jgi:C_GCAxxG_C_C family probable redox protein
MVKDLKMKKSEQAINCFNQKFNCSQAVLSTFAPEMGLDRETALKIATAFGAGIGCMALTCGAVSGAIMVIGLKYGIDDSAKKDEKNKCYKITREFMKTFEKKNNSIVCKEILGADIATKEGFDFALENKYFETKCTKFVADAVEILEKIL